MRTKKMNSLPNCDFCDQPALYDAPTLTGSWAYMCQEHYDTRSGSSLGTKFELRDQENLPAPSDKVLDGIELTPIEDVFTDVANREVQCPACGESRLLEADATGFFTCEGCKSKVGILALI